jgi:hypothetical protein
MPFLVILLLSPTDESGCRVFIRWFLRTRVEAGSNTSTVTLRVVGGDGNGSLKYETIKYGQEAYGSRTRKWLRWRVPAAIVNDRRVLSLERAPQINKSAIVRQKIWSKTPEGCFIPRQTGRRTVGRNVRPEFVQWLRLALSNGPKCVGLSCPIHLRTEAEPVSETMWSFVFHVQDDW